MSKILFVILIFCFVLTKTVKCQINDDFTLIKNYHKTDTSSISKKKVSYVFKGRNWAVKYNPFSLIFGGGLFFYQKVISPQIVMGCAFDVSCSNFSKGCIKQHGVFKGVALSADRLTRCTRLSSIDFHPVLFTPDGKVNDLPEYYRLKQ